MRKQKLEMIGDADLDRVIGGTGVAQIGSDWMVSGVIGASSLSSRSSVLSYHDDTSRAAHGPGFAGALGFLPSGSDDVNADGPSDYAPVNAGELTEAPQDVEANVDDDGCGGDGMGGGDGSGGGNGDGTGGGGGDGQGGDEGMGVMTCGFQDNDLPLDPNEALDDLINGLNEMGGCGDNGDDQGTVQNDPGYNPGGDPAAIAPQPGLGHLR